MGSSRVPRASSSTRSASRRWRVGRNLTALAARGELDPVVGREAEIDRTLDVLAKRHANCPCLVGAAGVGKTSVVRGLAQRIAAGETSRLSTTAS